MKTLKKIVVVGIGCDFIFDSSVIYQDAVFATDNTSQHTFSGASSIVLGAYEDANIEGERCDTDFIDQYKIDRELLQPPPLTGSITLISQGSVNFTSMLSAYGLKIIATENVHFASEAQGSNTHVGKLKYSISLGVITDAPELRISEKKLILSCSRSSEFYGKLNTESRHRNFLSYYDSYSDSYSDNENTT